MSIRSSISAVPLVYWIAVAVAVIANIVANAAFKTSVAVVSGESILDKVVQLLASPAFWLGAVSATVLLVSFLVAVKNGPMSTTYVLLTVPGDRRARRRRLPVIWRAS